MNLQVLAQEQKRVKGKVGVFAAIDNAY